MKTLTKLFVASALMFSYQASAQMTTMDYLKDYGLPCAAAMAGGLLASKDEGFAIGVGVCLGVGTATYLQSQRSRVEMRDEDFRKFVQIMDEANEKNNAKQNKKIDKALADMEQKQEQQIQGIREVMKEVVAERISMVGDSVKKEIKLYVERAGFMEDLEKKVMVRMREEVQTESKLRQKEIVEQTVEEVLKQVVLKKVGVPGEAQ